MKAYLVTWGTIVPLFAATHVSAYERWRAQSRNEMNASR